MTSSDDSSIIDLVTEGLSVTLAISRLPKAFDSVAINASSLDTDLTELKADWHELDAAYQRHHFNCKTCISAGRGSRYGQRCGAGTALWTLYSATAAHPAEPSSIQKLGAHS